jgi:hypothetical protein
LNFDGFLGLAVVGVSAPHAVDRTPQFANAPKRAKKIPAKPTAFGKDMFDSYPSWKN